MVASASVTDGIRRGLGGLSHPKKGAWDQLDSFYKHGLGYAQEMANRPQTLYGIADSPVGLAAWILDHDARSEAQEEPRASRLPRAPQAVEGAAAALTRGRAVCAGTGWWLGVAGSARGCPASRGRSQDADCTSLEHSGARCGLRASEVRTRSEAVEAAKRAHEMTLIGETDCDCDLRSGLAAAQQRPSARQAHVGLILMGRQPRLGNRNVQVTKDAIGFEQANRAI